MPTLAPLILLLLGVSLLGTFAGGASGLRFSLGTLRHWPTTRAWLAVSATGFTVAFIAIAGLVVLVAIAEVHLIELLNTGGPFVTISMSSD